MIFQRDYDNIKRVLVLLELTFKRKPVGELTLSPNEYRFQYNPYYMKSKNAVHLSYDFPLTTRTYIAKELFPFFKYKIPSKSTPVPFQIIHKDLSKKFIFEPMWDNEFTPEKLREFRKQLGVSGHDFGVAFGTTQTSITSVENKLGSTRDTLRRIEMFYEFPEIAISYINKYAVLLHPARKAKMIEKLQEMLKKKKRNC